jgi:hypothetical protein
MFPSGFEEKLAGARNTLYMHFILIKKPSVVFILRTKSR